jgi:hypothetical protein
MDLLIPIGLILVILYLGFNYKNLMGLKGKKGKGSEVFISGNKLLCKHCQHDRFIKRVSDFWSLTFRGFYAV